MNDRKATLPELIMARLSLGAVPVDGLYWYERQGRTWIDRSREQPNLKPWGASYHRPHYADTD